MPVYQYQGKHYDLPDGLSPEQAKAKIQAHLDGTKLGGQLDTLKNDGKSLADLGGGLLETATTGALDMFGGLAAQGLAVGDAALRGKSMSEARDLMAETYGESDAHKALEPHTKTGKWLGEKIGQGVESFKDYATDPTQSPLNAIPGVGEDLAKEYGGVAGSLASAIPELSALGLPEAGRSIAKGFDFKSKPRTKPTRGVDAQGLIDKLEAQPLDRPDPMGQMAQQLTGENKKPAKLGDYPQVDSVAPDPREVMGRMSEDLQKQGIQDAQYGPLFDQLEKQRLGQEAAALRERQAAAQQNAQGAGAFDEMAFQAQPKETPFNNPPPADALAWMANQIKERTGRDATTQELAQMWKEQAMGKDRQSAAQVAVDNRNAAITNEVNRNVDLNAHGLDKRRLGPDYKLGDSGRESMQFGQDRAQGIRTLDKTMEAMARDGRGAREAQVGPEAAPRDIIGNQLLEHMVSEKVMNHPLVQKAIERITKQEELLIKVAGMREEGRATASQLARVQKELDGLKASLERTQDNVQRAVKDGKSARPFNFKKQGGAVNPAVFKEGFEKLKQLADGTWLRAHGDGRALNIDASRDSRSVAKATFDAQHGFQQDHEGYYGRYGKEQNLESTWVKVEPEHRGKGYAEEIYKFATELGNDIKSSPYQTDSGKAMWNKFEQKGIAKNGMMNKQRGAIDPRAFEGLFPEFRNSKMRDAEGKLKAFYHGTSKDKDFGEIKPNTRGAWFTDDPKDASSYARENDSKGFKFQDGKYREVNTSDRVHQVYLNLENPYKVTEADHAMMNKENYAGAQRDFFEKLKREGYDGADFGHGTVVAFKPESIRSAISPNGKDKTIKSPGGRQKGAIQMDPSREPERKILDNIPGIQGTLKGLAPSKWTPEQAIEAARMGKDLDQNALQKLSNWFTKGGQYMVDRADNNPVIRYGVEKVAEAERKTRADVANLLHDKDFGLGAATRNMTKEEQVNIWALKNWADANQKALTPELLREHGATEAQIKYAETHQQVMDHAHEQMNKVWEALGKGPVTKRTSYAAMNASGDYRRLVYDHDGDVVGMVGSDLRWRVNGLKAELEKRGYTVGEEKYVGAKSREMGNAQAEMQQMLEFFAKNDPRVEELLQTVGDITSSMASKFMNMEVHTKAKKGIFGMDGRKEVGDLQWGGSLLTRDKALANAREGLKAQMNYAEMAIKWGHLTDAVQDVKKVLTDKDVNEKQPMAKQWTNDYISKALGANPTFGRHLEEFAGKLMGETGVGYSNVRGVIAISRRIVNTVLLGLNPGFWMTNVIQPFQAMPGMKAYLTSKGLKTDFDLGTGYSYVAKGGVDAFKTFTNPEKLTGVLKDAYNYARDNHVYGSDLIEHSNHVNKGLSYHSERISSAASGMIEQDTRAPMYYAFVRMLGENGMTKENGLFETAHNLTDMSMNNYSRTERPKAYDAAGPVGELASNLASYKHNELSRLAMFAREASDGNARPLLTHLTAAVMYSGVKGVVGYNALDWLIKEISSTQLVNHPTSLTRELMAFSEYVGGKIAPHVLSHGLFSLAGVDMANRLGLGDALTPSAFPGGSKLADIVSATGSALYHRDEAHTKEALREVAPGVATGPMDLTMFSKGDLSSRRSDLAGSVVRNKTDKYAKAVGFTGIHESVEKQKLYENKWIDSAYTDIRKSVSNTMKGEIYMNKAPTAKSIQKYMDARGDVGSLLKEIDRIGKEQNMSAKDRDMLKASTMRTAAAQGHLKDLTESFNENK